MPARYVPVTGGAARALQLSSVQALAGNRAAAQWVQRHSLQRKPIEQLDADLTTARQDGRWRDAALALNDMSDSDITARVAPARLSTADRGKLHAAIPEWAHRVRGAVLSVSYSEALQARDYHSAAITVNGFDDAGIQTRMDALDASAVLDFYAAAAAAMTGISQRRVLDALRNCYQRATTDPLGTKTLTIVSMMQKSGVPASAALAYVRLQLGLQLDRDDQKKNQTQEEVAGEVATVLSAAPVPPQIEAGNLAHSLIGGVYAGLNPMSFYDLPIAAYAARLANKFKARGSAKDLMTNLDMRPDIVDLARMQVYEIKPFTSLNLAIAEMRDYVDLMNGILKLSAFGPGSRWNPGASGVLPYTDAGKSGVLIWGCPVPGAILYKFLSKSEEKKAEQAREELHEPGSQYAASLPAAVAVGVPLAIVTAESMAALATYETLTAMLTAALRIAGQSLPRIAAGAAGAAAAK